jgi:hypothetical protein
MLFFNLTYNVSILYVLWLFFRSSQPIYGIIWLFFSAFVLASGGGTRIAQDFSSKKFSPLNLITSCYKISYQKVIKEIFIWNSGIHATNPTCFFPLYFSCFFLISIFAIQQNTRWIFYEIFRAKFSGEWRGEEMEMFGLLPTQGSNFFLLRIVLDLLDTKRNFWSALSQWRRRMWELE